MIHAKISSFRHGGGLKRSRHRHTSMSLASRSRRAGAGSSTLMESLVWSPQAAARSPITLSACASSFLDSLATCANKGATSNALACEHQRRMREWHFGEALTV